MLSIACKYTSFLLTKYISADKKWVDLQATVIKGIQLESRNLSEFW